MSFLYIGSSQLSAKMQSRACLKRENGEEIESSEGIENSEGIGSSEGRAH